MSVAEVKPKDDGPSALSELIENTALMIESENHVLSQNNLSGIEEAIARKAISLRDLGKVPTRKASDRLSAGDIEKVRGLKASLQRNILHLGAHANAVRELCEIVMQATRESERDGTYGLSRRFD